jgi:hypothetical protein
MDGDLERGEEAGMGFWMRNWLFFEGWVRIGVWRRDQRALLKKNLYLIFKKYSTLKFGIIKAPSIHSLKGTSFTSDSPEVNIDKEFRY